MQQVKQNKRKQKLEHNQQQKSGARITDTLLRIRKEPDITSKQRLKRNTKFKRIDIYQKQKRRFLGAETKNA